MRIHQAASSFRESREIEEKENRQKIIQTVQKCWSTYLGCDPILLEKPGIHVLPYSRELLKSKEVYVLKYYNGGTMVLVPGACVNEAIRITREYGLDEERLYELISRQYIGKRVHTGIILTSYLFIGNKLLPKDAKVRHIEKTEMKLYNDFMEQCLPEDKKEVFMEFSETFHEFYGYFEDGELVATCNYVRDNDADQIAHIGVLVRADKKWNGYGKRLVNTVSHEILERLLIPQYRVASDNVASRNIAKSLGYEWILEGYSLRIR